MKHDSKLTSKGQVTVPKDIRDALGLKPGQRVRFELDDDGNARIIKFDVEAKRAEWLGRLKEVQEQFKGHDPFDGKSGLEYQRWIRPDRIEP